jgi:hypothetical protein
VPKRGQHEHDAHDPRVSPGPNKPSKSVTITTGTPKKRETYERQARAHDDPGKPAQAAKREWRPDARGRNRGPGSPRARKGDLAKRDEERTYFPGGARGPESPPRYPRVTETPRGRMLPGEQHPEAWRQDLNPNALAGQNRGPATDEALKRLPTLYDRKDLHRRFRVLSDSELKQVPVLVPGMRLQQGATYVDLNHPERGVFRATGDLTAGPEDACVPKSEVPYELWHRLLAVIGLEDPARRRGH